MPDAWLHGVHVTKAGNSAEPPLLFYLAATSMPLNRPSSPDGDVEQERATEEIHCATSFWSSWTGHQLSVAGNKNIQVAVLSHQPRQVGNQSGMGTMKDTTKAEDNTCLPEACRPVEKTIHRRM